MTARQWRVQGFVPDGVFGWITKIEKLNWDAAKSHAEKCAAAHPEWEWRLLNDETAETVHIEKASAA